MQITKIPLVLSFTNTPTKRTPCAARWFLNMLRPMPAPCARFGCPWCTKTRTCSHGLACTMSLPAISFCPCRALRANGASTTTWTARTPNPPFKNGGHSARTFCARRLLTTFEWNGQDDSLPNPSYTTYCKRPPWNKLFLSPVDPKPFGIFPCCPSNTRTLNRSTTSRMPCTKALLRANK